MIECRKIEEEKTVLGRSYFLGGAGDIQSIKLPCCMMSFWETDLYPCVI